MARVDIDVESHDNTDLDTIRKKYKAFGDGITKDMETAGAKAGAGLSNAMAKSLEDLSARAVKARNKEITAVDRLRLAQQRLAEVGDEAKESQKIAAQNAFEEALRGVAEASGAAADAQKRLAAAQREAHESSMVSDSSGKGPNIDIKAGLKGMREYAVSEMKSAGIVAGAAFAGGLGAAITPTAAAGIFIGIAAAAQSGNQQLRAQYADTWEQIKTGAREASSELADDFIATGAQLGRTFNTLKPQLQEAMSASQPAVRDLTDGIDRMAKTAMPGLVVAAKASAQATDNVADVMESAGRGVANFFTESAEGAAAGGEAFSAFGRIVERLGSFAGRIIADLANSSGTVFPQLEHTVDAAASAIENLADTVLPSLASGAALGLSGLTLLLNLASSLISVLGPLAPVILNVATALKLLNMISVGGVKNQIDGVVGSIKAADGPMGKMKAGGLGLLTTFGPLGFAAGILSLGLSELAAENEKAARKEQQHRDAIKSLGSEFERTGGTVDTAIRKMVGDRILNDFSDAAKGAKDLGISLGDVTSAALKQGPAYDQLHDKLTSIIQKEKEYWEQNGGSEAASAAGMNPQVEAAQRLLTALEALGAETDGARARQQELADTMSAASGATNTLAEEFEALADKSASATDKIEALYQIQQRMAGLAPDVENATRNWEEFIDTFNKEGMNFEDKAAGTEKWAAALLDVDGKINLTSADGRKLYDTVTDMSKGFDETAVAMKANGDSSDAIRGKLQTMRDQFIDVADKMGFTRAQAIALADKYGLIPSRVDTLINSNLSPEIQKAIDLGGRIESLPDGNFVVHANTRNAQGMIDSFVQRNDGRVIHMSTTLSGVTTNRTYGGMKLQASGGPAGSVSFAAGGGPRTGPTIFNERGLETATLPNRDIISLGSLPTGSQVNPHAGNRSLGGGGGGIATVRLSWDGNPDSELMNVIVKNLRAEVEYSGGDPNVLLGGRS